MDNTVAAVHIDLPQILKAREDRADKQRSLLKQFQGSLICFTVNMPGSLKRSIVSKTVFLEGLRTIIKTLEELGIAPLFQETKNPISGPEAYIVAPEEALALKMNLSLIENRHHLGRLFDIDVIGQDGTPISRRDIGQAPRKCLICDQSAHNCARSQSHPLSDLMLKIDEIMDTFRILPEHPLV